MSLFKNLRKLKLLWLAIGYSASGWQPSTCSPDWVCCLQHGTGEPRWFCFFNVGKGQEKSTVSCPEKFHEIQIPVFTSRRLKDHSRALHLLWCKAASEQGQSTQRQQTPRGPRGLGCSLSDPPQCFQLQKSRVSHPSALLAQASVHGAEVLWTTSLCQNTP